MFLLSDGPTIKHTCMYARDIPLSTAVIKSNTTRILLAQKQLPLFEITILNQILNAISSSTNYLLNCNPCNEARGCKYGYKPEYSDSNNNINSISR